MQAAWRLAINSLSGRRLRTSLLLAAVGLSAALIVAVACGIASLNASLEFQLRSTVGSADVRLQSVGDSEFDAALLERARGWEGVAVAAPRAAGPIPLRNPETDQDGVAVGRGVDPQVEYDLRPLRLETGRAPTEPGEIALDARLVEELGASVGQTLEVQRFGEPLELTVVGVIESPALWALQRPQGVLTIETLERVTGEPRRLRSIDLSLAPAADPFEFAAKHGEGLPKNLLLQPTERITSGLNRNLRSSQIGFTVLSVLALIAASFIVLTGLTTGVVERQRELAIVRCLGGARWQVGMAQVLLGGIFGAGGALIGAPLGVGLAAAGAALYADQLPAGLRISTLGVSLATVGATVTGMLAGAWPAVMASRISPLEALAARAAPPRARSVVMALVIGLALVGLDTALVGLPDSGQVVFWGHVLGGVQAMFVGYFLLGVPLVLLAARLGAPALGALLRVPHSMIQRSVTAKPFRHGLTAASLMVGLALMTVIWTNGRALMRDWIGAIEFPDAFVHGVLGLTPEDQAKVEALPFVEATSAITILRTDSDEFGVRGLQSIGTNFVAFEPATFFDMASITWVEGDPQRAKERLDEGGAVIVAREFQVARELGVGDTVTLEHAGREHTFEIVGVVASPGLDVASRYFDIGREQRRQALHAVFGSRADLIEKFGDDSVQLIQIDLADDVDDEAAVEEIRRTLAGTVLAVGSGREIKETILGVVGGSLTVMSSVAVVAILIACFGVGNVIVASVDARRFEFGVLRAVGARGGTLARLVLAEAVIMALTAGALGTLLGAHAAWAEQRLYQLLAGLDLSLRLPAGPVAAGWLIVLSMALLAATPSAAALARRSPRALLSATKG